MRSEGGKQFLPKCFTDDSDCGDITNLWELAVIVA